MTCVIHCYAVLAIVSNSYPPLQGRLPTRYSPVRRFPSLHLTEVSFQDFSLDLHVLGTPPAFILSQDQTLMFKFVRSKSVWLILPFYCCFRFLFSEISLRTFCSVWNFQGCITVYLSRCCSSCWKYFQKNFRSCRSDSLLSLS